VILKKNSKKIQKLYKTCENPQKFRKSHKKSFINMLKTLKKALKIPSASINESFT
jgi:hypothetical protein